MKIQQVVRSRAALVRRMLVAELLARRGEGPLAPRFPGAMAAQRKRRDGPR